MRTTYTNGEIDAAVSRFERIINGARNSNHASEEALEIADRAISGTAGNNDLVTEMRVWADQLLADGLEIGAATARKAAATIERLSKDHTVLHPVDYAAFFSARDNPPAPTDKLRYTLKPEGEKMDVWQRIAADPELANARRKLSIHEIRLIIKHAKEAV